MKKYLFPIVLAIPLALAACGPSEAELRQQEEERHQQMLDKANQAAIERCEKEVSEFAKYPAAVEFPNDIYMDVGEPDPEHGPEGTDYYGVTFGTALFVNSFGVPTEYDYGCVTYHDEEGDLKRVQADARKKGLLSSYSYSPSQDSLK